MIRFAGILDYIIGIVLVIMGFANMKDVVTGVAYIILGVALFFNGYVYMTVAYHDERLK